MMNRNLERIAIAAAAECERQHVDELALVNLLTAHMYAMRHAHRAPADDDIIEMGHLVEPEINRAGYRRTAVAVPDGTSTPADWHDVDDAMARMMIQLAVNWPNVFATDVIHAMLSVHPFRDGNGRVAWLLYNWITGTLAEPAPLPDLFGVER